ncbi:hypothetical protein BC937DRAFT_92319 [Endogone sp. FLAS-F59071]|nr:hypothetical protein BC937DRAFT_92319 [Endogone sp. FLAS-F59071]|eukprot:RUS23105.1 hypothetical protein BC937DRAFT_92319 [Endogone sp. FLAS-F59071]
MFSFLRIPRLLRPSQRLFYTTARNQIQYTAEKYGYTRDSRFKQNLLVVKHLQLSDQDIEHFRSVLSDNGLVTGSEDDLYPFNTDWMNKYRGKSQLVLKPKTTQQVSQLLKYCSENKLAVVPQGGNTGLVGGSVPVFDEIIISTQGMNNIRSFDAVSGALVCDAGCVLETLDDYIVDRGFIMPLDLGAKGSCHIGGNVATNAGGLRLLRYGSLHGTVLGLEAVLPDGTILDNLSTLRKDNTGYDLKQLFIGSEGTLGIVTGVSILTPRRPKAILFYNRFLTHFAVNVAFLGLNSFEDVQKAYMQSKSELSEILSAFEFWDKQAFGLVKEHLVHTKDPLQSDYAFYVLVETSGSNKEHDDEKLNAYLENIMSNNVVQDGVVAQDETQIKNLWSIREGIPEAISKTGAIYKYDISMPVPVLYQMVEAMRDRLFRAGVYGTPDSPIIEIVGFGHIGDGNLHLNIATRKYDSDILDLIEPYVFEWIAPRSYGRIIELSNLNDRLAEQKGSISAEHGLGVSKNKFLHYSKSGPMIHLMKTIKQLVDPNGIMNPYKFLPA